jgi:hypothetical protein
MRAAQFCCSHNGEIPAERRFGSPEQATAAGRLGGRPRKHEQLTLPIDTPDGPATDPRAALERAAWASRVCRGVAALGPAGRVVYEQALENLVAWRKVRDQAEAEGGDELVATEARRRFHGFVDAVGEAAGAGPWPRDDLRTR